MPLEFVNEELNKLRHVELNLCIKSSSYQFTEILLQI